MITEDLVTPITLLISHHIFSHTQPLPRPLAYDAQSARTEMISKKSRVLFPVLPISVLFLSVILRAECVHLYDVVTAPCFCSSGLFHFNGLTCFWKISRHHHSGALNFRHRACLCPAWEPRSSALRLAGAARILTEAANGTPRWAETSSPQASAPVRWEYWCWKWFMIEYWWSFLCAYSGIWPVCVN